MSDRAKATLSEPIGPDDTTSKAGMARTLVVQFMGMALVYPRESVISALVTSTVMLILRRPMNPDTDTEILAAMEAFIEGIYEHQDVLREDATHMAPMPKQAM